MKKKSIIISEKSHKELVLLSESFDSNLGFMVESMISYFKKTGIHPKEALQNPSAMIKVLDKRVVSFLKVQEKEILNPMRSELFKYSQTQIQKLDIIIEGINKNEEFQNKIKSTIQSHIKVINEAMEKLNKFDHVRTETTKAELIMIKKAIIELAHFMDQKNKSSLQGKLNSIFKNAD